MARSITYWYDIIIAEKNTMANLNGLQPNIDSAATLLTDITTTSKVARWRLWVWCVAAGAYALDVLFDLFKIELLDIASRTRIGTIPWWTAISKDYQHGYNLVWQNSRFEYPIVDEAAKIIKRSAAQENGIVINIKVAKLVGSVVTPLNAIELAGFAAFIDRVRPACIPYNIITDDPDDIKLYIHVVYDALVLTATGESILTPGVFPVNDAVNNYISNIIFNGKFELCNVIDQIQLATGVVSAYVTGAESRYGVNPFVSFSESVVANAGHFIIHSGTPLSSSITYTADV